MGQVTNVEVEAVGSKGGVGKTGKPYTKYSFKTSQGWFNCDFEDPSVNKGEIISFAFTDSQWGKKVDVKSIEKVGGASVASSGQSVPVSADNRQAAIIRQNSLTNAVNLLSSTPLVGDASVDELADIAIKVAREFFKFSADIKDDDDE